MDKDVAISIINQFPTFVDNAKTMIECENEKNMS